jgi:hypothetical protein
MDPYPRVPQLGCRLENVGNPVQIRECLRIAPAIP